MDDTEQKPLLDMEGGPEEEWDRVDDLPADIPAITVQELIHQDPDNVLSNIKAGVVKLGEFRVEDTLLLEALGDESMLTMGAEVARIGFEPLWRRRLAALTRRRRKPRGGPGWSRMVTAEAFVVRIRNAAHPNEEGLLRPLIKRWQAGGCHYSVFGLPAVQAVLEFKWHTFGRHLLNLELGCFLTWLVSFSLFLLLWQDEDPALSLPELLSTLSGQVTVGAELVSLAAMTPFLVIEWGTLTAYAAGWLSMWNIMDIATYVLQISIAVMHLGRSSSPGLTEMIAAQVVLLFFRLNYFSRLFANKFSFLDSLKKVVMDCRFYFLFLLLMVFGFACSYYVLFKYDQKLPQFSDISHSILTVLNYAMGGVNLATMLDSRNPRAALVLSIIYQFSMSMVLMNLLVGIICNSVAQATQHEELKGLLSRAQAVDELESTLPKWAERLMPHAYPSYVHVLRLDPKSLETIDSTMLWRRGPPQAHSGPGGGGGGAAAAGGGGGAGGGSKEQLDAVLAELAALRMQVATLNDLLHTAVPSLPPSPSGSA